MNWVEVYKSGKSYNTILLNIDQFSRIEMIGANHPNGDRYVYKFTDASNNTFQYVADELVEDQISTSIIPAEPGYRVYQVEEGLKHYNTDEIYDHPVIAWKLIRDQRPIPIADAPIHLHAEWVFKKNGGDWFHGDGTRFRSLSGWLEDLNRTAVLRGAVA